MEEIAATFAFIVVAVVAFTAGYMLNQEELETLRAENDRQFFEDLTEVDFVREITEEDIITEVYSA